VRPGADFLAHVRCLGIACQSELEKHLQKPAKIMKINDLRKAWVENQRLA
jgi:hypothetical protein